MFLTWKCIPKLRTHLSKKHEKTNSPSLPTAIGIALPLPYHPQRPLPHLHLQSSESFCPLLSLPSFCLSRHAPPVMPWVPQPGKGQWVFFLKQNLIGTSTETSGSPTPRVVRALTEIPRDILPILCYPLSYTTYSLTHPHHAPPT